MRGHKLIYLLCAFGWGEVGGRGSRGRAAEEEGGDGLEERVCGCEVETQSQGCEGEGGVDEDTAEKSAGRWLEWSYIVFQLIDILS